MRTLIINSYAGSLTLGASAAGAEIIGSYEDNGFGLDIQRANFPRLNFVDQYKDWPHRDLSDTVVLAHPPCSAFSVQNSSAAARGIGSAAFSCTIKVLNYTMNPRNHKHRAAAIAIESVMGALGGAWDVHDAFAREYGYDVYRVTKNSLLFGVPQWRDRFWVVFVRKGLGAREMTWGLTPTLRTIDQVITPVNTGPAPYDCDRDLMRLHRRLSGRGSRHSREHGCDEMTCANEAHWKRDTRFEKTKFTPKQLALLFSTKRDPADFHSRVSGVSVDRIMHKHLFPKRKLGVVTKNLVTLFTSQQLHYLNPAGYAPVLLGSSWWYLDGRNVTERGYKAAMGFPLNYAFPEPGGYRRQMRMYLSKGVCPPVAQWVWTNVVDHISGRMTTKAIPSQTFVKTCRPNGGVVSFHLGRSTHDPGNIETLALRDVSYEEEEADEDAE